MREKLPPDKKPLIQSYWVPLDIGRFSAAGTPSSGRVRAWQRAGMTDLVTLVKERHVPAWLPEQCAALGVQWHHFPLSGRVLAAEQDQQSLAQVPAFVASLQQRSQPPSVVVHCMAGMHRTGVFLYFVLRNAGIPPEEILPHIAQMRAITAEELTKNTRKNGVLLRRAEKLYQKLILQTG